MRQFVKTTPAGACCALLVLLSACGGLQKKQFYVPPKALALLEKQSASPLRTPAPYTSTAPSAQDRRIAAGVNAKGEQLQGIASWYGPNFHNKKTASGELFDQHQVSAAHRILPMDTIVRVHRTDTGQSLDLRINDRGPYKKGRVIDLSRRAAEILNMKDRGTAPVRIEVLKMPPGYDPSLGLAPYKQKVVQLSVFSRHDSAQRFKNMLSRKYSRLPLIIDRPHSSRHYQVLVGPYAQSAQAQSISQSLQRDGYTTFVRSYRK